MTAKELMVELNRMDGSCEVNVETLIREPLTGEMVAKVIGTVDVVTVNGSKVYISTWVKGS